MFGYAEKEKIPPVHKPSDRRPTRPAQSFNPSDLMSIKYNLKRVSSQPKITLYGKFITLPEDWSKEFMNRLMDIIKTAAKKYSIGITDGQFTVLKKNLTEALASTSPGDTNTPELLSVLFEQMTENTIPLSTDFINEIKQNCKSYAEEAGLQKDPATNSVTTFLSQWSNFNPDSSMGDINPRDYLYKNIDDVMPLLNIDQVSTTKDDDAEKNRSKAADLILGQLKSPLTADQLRIILLDLNKIYSPQSKKPYKQGLRYHSAQIGQGDSAIGTTPAMEVEASVNQVINKIVDNLAPCESQPQKGESLSDEMLKKVIATSAMAYQLLISIHPFSDGNGRTCRMFANYILMRYGLLPATFSADSAKLSMYDKNSFEENDTDDPKKLNTPEKAYEAMTTALAASLDKLHSPSSSQAQAAENQ